MSSIALAQALAPIAASAAPAYVQIVKVPGLVVTSGTPLTQTNVDGSNGTTSSTRVGNAVLKIAPSVLSYADTIVGATSNVQTVTLSNLGSAALTTGTLSASAEFAVGPNCNGVTLAPLATCQVNVQFAPTQPASQPVPGSISVPLISGTNSGVGSILTQAAAAHWAPTANPAFTLSASSVNFGNVNIGSTATRTITVLNSGDTALSASSIVFTGNAFSTTHNCPSVLAVGSSCAVTVVFTPTEGATNNANLTVGFNGVASKSASILATGQGDLLSADTSSQSFGPVLLLANKSLTYTVTNSGALSAALTYGPLPSEVTRQGTCSATLASGASCTVILKYAPTTAAGVSGALTVTAPNTSVSLEYSGTGVEAPSFTLTPASYNYGNVAIGANSAKTVTLENTGNVPLSVTGISLVGDNYTLTANSCPATLAVGTSCTASVSYAPIAAATSNATLTASIQGLTAKTVSFTGVGQANPSFVTSVSSLTFSNLAVGSTALRSTVIQNNGNVPLSFSSISVSGAAYTATHDCGATLPVAASCTANVTFTPTTNGTRTGFLTINYAGVATKNVALTGVGLADNLSVTPSSQNFGGVLIGSSSALTYTLSNAGNVSAPLDFGTLPAEVTRSGTCSTSLAASSSCSIILTYAPLTSAGVSGALTVTAQNTNVSMSYAGSGVEAPSFTLSPASYDYGNVAIGATSAKVFTVANTGNMPLTVTGVALTGTDYALSANTCPTALAVGASCTATVTFAPLNAATAPATLTVSIQGLADKSSAITGVGQANPSFTSSVSSLNFSNVAVGSNAFQSTLIQNTGNVPLSLSSVTVVGASYSASHDCGASLPVASSCTINTTFTPTTNGTSTGTLTVTYAGLTAKGVSLTGVGLSDNLSVNTASQSFGTVLVGSSGALTYTLTNGGNVAAPLNYSALPATVTRSGTCAASLATSASCTVILTYTPTDGTALSGSLTVSSTNTSKTLSFTGTPQLPPGFSVSPASLSYGTVNVASSNQQTVTVTNTGGSALGAVVVTVPTNVTYSKTCGATLAIGANCSVTFTFSSATETNYSNSATIAISGVSTKTLPVTATVVGVPQVSATAPGLSGNTLAITSITNNTSQVVLNVKNTGTGALGITSAPALTTGTRFTIGTNTCTNGASVAVGSSCNITLQFLPNANGSVSDTLAFSTSAGVQSFTLNGTGIASTGIYASCAALKTAAPSTVSGSYNIDPDGAGTGPVINVHCEMTLDSGGWTRVLALGDDTRYFNSKWAMDGSDVITGTPTLASQEVKIGPAYQGITSFQSMLFVSATNSANWVSINSLARTQSLKTLIGPSKSSIGLGTSSSTAVVAVNNSTQVRKGGTWSFGNPEGALVFNACSNDSSNATDSDNECSRLGPKFTFGYVFNWNGIGTTWDGGSEGAAYRTTYFIGESVAPSAHSPMYVYVK